MSDQDELLSIVMAIATLLAEQESVSKNPWATGTTEWQRYEDQQTLRRTRIEGDLEALRVQREELKAILGPEGTSGFIGHKGFSG